MPTLSTKGRYRAVGLLAALLAAPGCDVAYPEVVVINDTDEQVLLRNPSFSGCVWPTVLAYGDATAPRSCLPGEDRVHVQKLDAAAYCRQQAADGTIAGVGLCPIEPGRARGEASSPTDPGLVNEQPTWFDYQTITPHQADYGEFLVVEIRLAELEQDFSAVGPYGH